MSDPNRPSQPRIIPYKNGEAALLHEASGTQIVLHPHAIGEMAIVVSGHVTLGIANGEVVHNLGGRPRSLPDKPITVTIGEEYPQELGVTGTVLAVVVPATVHGSTSSSGEHYGESPFHALRELGGEPDAGWQNEH